MTIQLITATWLLFAASPGEIALNLDLAAAKAYNNGGRDGRRWKGIPRRILSSVVRLEGGKMIRSARRFLIGLLLGIGATLAVTEDKVAFRQTEEGLEITCKTKLFEQNRELPRQITELVTKTCQKWR
jgi:hypothetical protein